LERYVELLGKAENHKPLVPLGPACSLLLRNRRLPVFQCDEKGSSGHNLMLSLRILLILKRSQMVEILD
jgi:hypothetical protein